MARKPTDSEYSDPTEASGPASDDFLPPPTDGLDHEADEQEAAMMASTYGADLTELKAQIEARLTASCVEANAEGHVQSLESDNIVGIGYSTVDAEDLASGVAVGEPGTPGLVVYTQERVSLEALQAEICSVAGTHALDTVAIKQVHTGVIDALSHRMRMRPAPGGISIGHVNVTAGTLGCLVRGNSAPRNQRLMLLSNNHVIANSNGARLGDSIVQPGRADGGSHPRDQIAILERFVPINFSGAANFVDAATGWCWPDRVRRELMFLAGTTPRYFRLGNCVKRATVGMTVGKTGRTTQLRQGRVTATGVTVNVNFGAGRIAQFRDQIAIRGQSGEFSAGGDSGSIVWEWTSQRCVVGLLFAGGGGTTFANPFSRVLSALDVRLEV